MYFDTSDTVADTQRTGASELATESVQPERRVGQSGHHHSAQYRAQERLKWTVVDLGLLNTAVCVKSEIETATWREHERDL